jgi:hypothetical protein
VIRIINLAYKDTVEADVYFALGRRINLFQGIVGKLQPILSRLPKQFERLALEKVEHREAAKLRFLSDFERMTREANEAPFDIDEVAIEALEMPKLPPPALTLEDLDAALNRPAMRPPQLQWQPLDLRSYAVALPGMATRVRATTSAEVFDDHFESHEFFSPAGQLFEQIADGQGTVDEATEATTGRFWLIEPVGGQGPCELVAATPEGPRRISSLAELMVALQTPAPPVELDKAAWPNAKLRTLA